MRPGRKPALRRRSHCNPACVQPPNFGDFTWELPCPPWPLCLACCMLARAGCAIRPRLIPLQVFRARSSTTCSSSRLAAAIQSPSRLRRWQTVHPRCRAIARCGATGHSLRARRSNSRLQRRPEVRTALRATRHNQKRRPPIGASKPRCAAVFWQAWGQASAQAVSRSFAELRLQKPDGWSLLGAWPMCAQSSTAWPHPNLRCEPAEPTAEADSRQPTADKPTARWGFLWSRRTLNGARTSGLPSAALPASLRPQCAAGYGAGARHQAI